MQDLRVCFERWLRSRASPLEAGLGRRYQVAAVPPRTEEISFDWISYWPLTRPCTDSADVDLWALRSTPAGTAAYSRVCRDLELVNCMYDQILEQLRTAGSPPKQRLALRGNLVSPSVRPHPSLNLACEIGFRIRLWTYFFRGGVFDVLPHCASFAPSPREKAGMLERLLRTISMHP